MKFTASSVASSAFFRQWLEPLMNSDECLGEDEDIDLTRLAAHSSLFNDPMNARGSANKWAGITLS
jgi:hypothetical protein